jgi:hypothetical protein
MIDMNSDGYISSIGLHGLNPDETYSKRTMDADIAMNTQKYLFPLAGESDSSRMSSCGIGTELIIDDL